MTPAAAEFTLQQYEVVTGSAKRQTVLTGFFLGGPRVWAGPAVDWIQVSSPAESAAAAARDAGLTLLRIGKRHLLSRVY